MILSKVVLGSWVMTMHGSKEQSKQTALIGKIGVDAKNCDTISSILERIGKGDSQRET